jgi:hypothetical protein
MRGQTNNSHFIKELFCFKPRYSMLLFNSTPEHLVFDRFYSLLNEALLVASMITMLL